MTGVSSPRLVLILISVILSGCTMKEQTAASMPSAIPAPPMPPAIPTPPMPPDLTRGQIFADIPGVGAGVGDSVFFAFDKSDLDKSAHNTLRKQVEWLQHYPGVNVIVE